MQAMRLHKTRNFLEHRQAKRKALDLSAALLSANNHFSKQEIGVNFELEDFLQERVDGQHSLNDILQKKRHLIFDRLREKLMRRTFSARGYREVMDVVRRHQQSCFFNRFYNK